LKGRELGALGSGRGSCLSGAAILGQAERGQHVSRTLNVECTITPHIRSVSV